MAVPKNRHTKSRRDRKRSHLKLTASASQHCTKCSALVLPHTVCETCGSYKGREVIDVLGKLNKKERKQREKEIEQQKEEAAPAAASMEELSKGS